MTRKKIEIKNVTDAFLFLKNTSDEEIKMYSVKELLEVAKYCHVVGRHNMKKDEILDKVLEMKHKREEREAIAKEKHEKGIEVIVAVRLNSGKLTTAKIIDIDESKGENKRYFKLQTATGLMIDVYGERIEWYKFQKFFPKFIYEELKEKRKAYDKERKVNE